MISSKPATTANKILSIPKISHTDRATIMAENNTRTFHAVMFPWLAMGHMIPFLHLSNKLAERGHTVSFLVPIKTQPKLHPLNHFPHLISFIPLHVPHVPGLPPGAETMSSVPLTDAPLLAVAFDQLQTQIDLILPTLINPRFIFYDFAHWVPALSRKLSIKSISFFIVSPIIHAFMNLDYVIQSGKQATAQDLLQPPPDFPTTSTSSFYLPRFKLPNALRFFKGFGINITFYERLTAWRKESDAIAFRTCREVEGPFCDYIESHCRKPVLLSGPLLPELQLSEELEERWAEWLGRFKEGSVVYCAFGSECRLEKDQFQELVLGLELTGLPFLAVLKPPLGAETVEEALPEGFNERLVLGGGRGVVHGGWVQQQQILKHGSIGCFVNHCGPASMWESLVGNEQIVVVPQLPDQFFNAQLMSGELKVAVEVERREEDGWFTRENVCRAVKLVMDEGSQVGKELRSNRAKWKGILLQEGFESSYMDSFIVNLESL